MSEKRQPDFDLCVKRKIGDAKAKIGCGWQNEDGSISIQLNICTVLKQDDGIFINLFKRDRRKT